ncbi:MAG: hypothetical protein FJ320_10270 [SAR202 cluster bacterium]|nr:hypothetical protein [SAR202 cluster bacterium]
MRNRLRHLSSQEWLAIAGLLFAGMLFLAPHAFDGVPMWLTKVAFFLLVALFIVAICAAFDTKGKVSRWIRTNKVKPGYQDNKEMTPTLAGNFRYLLNLVWEHMLPRILTELDDEAYLKRTRAQNRRRGKSLNSVWTRINVWIKKIRLKRIVNQHHAAIVDLLNRQPHRDKLPKWYTEQDRDEAKMLQDELAAKLIQLDEAIQKCDYRSIENWQGHYAKAMAYWGNVLKEIRGEINRIHDDAATAVRVIT